MPGGGREARPFKVTPRGQIFTIEFGLRQQHSFSPFFYFFLLCHLGSIYSALLSLLNANPLREKGNGKENHLLSAYLLQVRHSTQQRRFTFGISRNPVKYR